MRSHLKRRHFFTLALAIAVAGYGLLEIERWTLTWDRHREWADIRRIRATARRELVATLQRIVSDSSSQQSTEIAVTGTIRNGTLVFPWEQNPRVASLQSFELQQALDLRRAFDRGDLLLSRISTTTGELRRQPASQVWECVGLELWLVGLAATRDDGGATFVAVRGRPILNRLERSLSTADVTVYFDTITGTLVERLGPEFPDLRIYINYTRGASYQVPRTLTTVVFISIIGLAIIGMLFVVRAVNRQLELADLRGQFVASVSHELRTPLTAIRMFAETLQMNRPLAPVARAEYLDTIVNESTRLTRLIDNVLDFSKIEGANRSYRFEMAFLPSLVRQAAETMEYPLARGGFDLAVTIDETVPAVRVDADALQQALLNLLSNAMKYSGDNRRIDLTLKCADGDAVVSVTDYGAGIATQDHARIFKRYYRVSTPENSRIAGAGLGLAVVSHIVEAHGGTVKVTSAVGEGSTFAIHLPLGDTARDHS